MTYVFHTIIKVYAYDYLSIVSVCLSICRLFTSLYFSVLNAKLKKRHIFL